ncbi:MAG: DUF4384 domain-containing protein [Oscillatoria sp. SIO1A7]|nr:DUF4384 domain-containing protein [Oscillatoria sp. SIO1A7]
MGVNRRKLLQRASGLLAALGISETLLWRSSSSYYQALAEPTARKLALLVGINQYPDGTPLAGCATDVDLQRELLENRFGFNKSDIVTLTDDRATRANIEEALIDHLGKQTRSGDVVVFHFSGYGRRLNWANSPEGASSLVPVDGGVPNSDGQEVNDLLTETLWLLLRSLPTSRAIAVLDTCFAYPGSNLQGNLRIRSRPSTPTAQPSREEIALLEKLKITSKRGSQSPLPGIIITATGPEQLAAETRWNGFGAGLFSYALTQHLWEATPATTLKFSLQKTSCSVQQITGEEQQPQVAQGQDPGTWNSIFIPPYQPGADGAIALVEEGGKTGQVWLGGLPAKVLDSYGENSIFSVVSQNNKNNDLTPTPALLQIRSRDGLRAKAQIVGKAEIPLQKGQLLQESIRVIPRNLKLTVGLDPSLERIERVDATSAFASIPQVSAVVAGDTPADCLFGPVRKALGQNPKVALASIPKGSYALFSPGKNLLRNTMGEGGEAIKSAALRLVPKLQTLRAAKLIRTTANESSSRLGVRATLEMLEPQKKGLIQAFTRRAPWAVPSKGVLSTEGVEGSILSLPQGSRIRYQLLNYSKKPLYCLLFGLHSNGSTFALYPFFHSPSDSSDRPQLEQNLIPPGTSLTIPKEGGGSPWSINGPPGLAEAHIICSTSPFTQTFMVLAGAMTSQRDMQGTIDLRDSLAFAGAVLRDLNEASSSSVQSSGISADDWNLDVNHWATLSFIYRVV